MNTDPSIDLCRIEATAHALRGAEARRLVLALRGWLRRRVLTRRIAAPTLA